MADLAGALDAALRARYRVAEVRTPVTQRRGLLARMNQLEALHKRPGDTPTQTRRRAAEAAGIPDRTWRDWKSGTHPPSARGARKLETAYAKQITNPAFARALKRKGPPGRVTVTAKIRWTDSDKKKYNRTPDRTVKFTNMRGVMGAVIRAWRGAGPEAAADAFERLTSAQYRVPDDDDGGPGIRFEPDAHGNVQIEFP